jgi:hypothetical protein
MVLFWEAAPQAGRRQESRLIDLPFAKTWDPGCKFMYLHIKEPGRELRPVIRDLRLAVYVILQGGGGCLCFLGRYCFCKWFERVEGALVMAIFLLQPPQLWGFLANAQWCNLANGLFGLRTCCPSILSSLSLPSFVLHFFFLV